MTELGCGCKDLLKCSVMTDSERCSRRMRAMRVDTWGRILLEYGEHGRGLYPRRVIKQREKNAPYKECFLNNPGFHGVIYTTS